MRAALSSLATPGAATLKGEPGLQAREPRHAKMTFKPKVTAKHSALFLRETIAEGSESPLLVSQKEHQEKVTQLTFEKKTGRAVFSCRERKKLRHGKLRNKTIRVVSDINHL